MGIPKALLPYSDAGLQAVAAYADWATASSWM